jgi:hypothetical protein
MFSRAKLALGIVLGKTTAIAGRSVLVLPDDLFIVSYPRSGNTWARFLVGNLVSPDEPITFANLEHRVPDIYQNSNDQLLRQTRPRVLKSHEYFDPRYKNLIYIVRDPRDVAVSYYHYHIKTRRIEEEHPVDRFVARYVAGELDPFGSWGDNVGSWLGARAVTKGFLLLRYEDLLLEPARELNRIATYMELPASTERLNQIVEMSSAGTMRRMEQDQSDSWRPMTKTRKDKPFVRAAKAGIWRYELPVGAARQIEVAWKRQMKELEYL